MSTPYSTKPSKLAYTEPIPQKSTIKKPRNRILSQKKESKQAANEVREPLPSSSKNRSLRQDSKPERYSRVVIEKKRSLTEERRNQSPTQQSRIPRQGMNVSYANQLTSNFRSAVSESKLQKQLRQSESQNGKVICRSLFRKKSQEKGILQEQKRSLAKLAEIKKSMQFQKGAMLSSSMIKYRSTSSKGKIEKKETEEAKNFKVKSKVIEDYVAYIHGRCNQIYTVGFDYSYLRKLSRSQVQNVIDFGYFKILESIMLCTQDIYAKNGKQNRQNSATLNLLREYSLLYFKLFEKNMMQVVLVTHYFKLSQSSVTYFFVLTRIYFILQHELAITEQIFDPNYFLTMQKSLNLIIEISRILYNGHHDIYAQNNYIAQTFKLLKITNQIEKKLIGLTAYIKSLCNSTQNIKKIKEMVQQFHPLEIGFNFHGLQLEYLSQLEVTLCWKHFKLPPIPFLPPKNPAKRYTLVIGINKLLLSYDGQTRILHHRPFSNKLLAKMSQLFELVAFSSEGKQVSDQLIDCLEKSEQFFSYRLYKQHLSFRDGVMSKDLTKLGRQTQKVLMVDVEEEGRNTQQKGTIFVQPFSDDRQDKELLNLIDRIEWILKGDPDDITSKIPQYFKSLEHIEEELEENNTISTTK